MTPLPQPTLGRQVEYWTHGSPDGKYASRAVPATIVTPNSGDNSACDLFIMNPTGTFHGLKTPYAETPTPGHWSWPEHMRRAAGFDS